MWEKRIFAKRKVIISLLATNLSVYLFVSYVLVFLCFFLILTSCKKQDSAKKEVVLYCSVDQEFAEPVIAQFEKQTGIKVLARFDVEATKTVGLYTQ